MSDVPHNWPDNHGELSLLFLGIVSLAVFFLFRWAFAILPREQWQILAVLPRHRADSNQWHGLNLTYYGFITASAVTLAAGNMLFLLGAIHVPLGISLLFVLSLMSFAVPASKIIAKVVEKKAFTFTIGGASFTGLVMAPVVAVAINWMHHQPDVLPVLPALSALVISFALGEGIGRLACISYGCCYGKPLSACAPIMQTTFKTLHFRFTGATKKIAYAGNLESVPVVPIQAITAIVSTTGYLIGMGLFLTGRFAAGLLAALVITQVWRAVSETWRADHRGHGSISTYQVMSVVGIGYMVAVTMFVPSSPLVAPDLLMGLHSLWDPTVLLFLQSAWAGIFLFMGRSHVTGSVLSFFVHKEHL